MKYLISHKKFVVAMGILGIFLLSAFFVPVYAQESSTAGLSPVLFIVYAILMFIRSIVGMLVSIAGTLVSLALGFNQDLVSLTTDADGFIYVGWAVFRDLANLGFVLGIVIIAIATILRYKGYVAQSILWKLIVAALLVNFSLIIAGSMVSVANSFSNFFIDSIVGARVSSADGAWEKAVLVGNVMADRFGFLDYLSEGSDSSSSGLSDAAIQAALKGTPQGYFAYYGYKIFSLLQKTDVDLGEIVAVFVMILTGFIIFLVLLGFAAMLLLRYFFIAFLLILSPLAWLLWIFPHTQGQWKKWWDRFIHWVIYAPAVLLFVWVAMTFMSVGDSYLKISTKRAVTQSGFGLDAADNIDRPNGAPMDTLMFSIMAGALIIGGMKAAQAFGFGGTALAMGAATKMGGWAKTKARRVAARSGRRALQSKYTGGRALQAGLTKMGSSRVLKWTGLGQLAGAGARGLSRAETNLAKQSQEHIEDFKKSLSAMSPKEIARLLPTMNDSQRAAALEQLASKGNLGEASGKMNLDQTLASIKKMEAVGRIKDANDLMKRLGMNKAMMEALLAGDDAKYEAEAEKFFDGLSGEDLKKYVENNGEAMFSTNESGTYDKVLPGLDENQTEKVRKAFVQHATTDVGKAIAATAAKIKKGRTLNAFYREVLSGIGDIETEVTETIETGLVDESGKPTKKTTTKKETIKVVDLLQKAQENGDYGPLYAALEKSSNPKHKAMVAKMKKGMDAAISGAYAPDKKDEKGDEKKGEPKEKKESK